MKKHHTGEFYTGGWHAIYSDIRWSMGQLHGFWLRIALLLGFGCGLVFLSIGSAVINRQLVDMAADKLSFQMLCVLAAACLAASIFVNGISSYLSELVTMRLCSSVRLKALKSILTSEWMHRRGMHTQEYVTRLTQDVEMAVGGTVRFLVGAATALLQLVMAFGLLWQYDKPLAKLALFAAPIAAAVGVLSGRKLHHLQDLVREAETKVRVNLEEDFMMADVLAAFDAQAGAQLHMKHLEEERIRRINDKRRCSLLTGAAVSVVFSGTSLCALCVGAGRVSGGLMSYGTMTAMLTLIGQVQNPVYRFCNLLASQISVLTSARRVRVIMEYPKEEQPDKKANTKVENKRQEGQDKPKAVGLEADQLTLTYEGKAVIQDLSFRIKPGNFVIVQGLSGIGKTTLIRGILGFLRPQSGKLELCIGQEKVSCSKESRQLIGYVPQGKSLFSGTIAQNLRLGKPDASREEMKEALKAACAWDFVSAMEDEMDTQLGEQAQRLSEGQAQRIMLARALLKPAGLLLLDEATSALDEVTERQVLLNIRKLYRDRTCLFVTHRLSTVSLADEVIKL